MIIDGYVWLDAHHRPGLGAILHEALTRRVPVVGVAKTMFGDALSWCIPVVRGTVGDHYLLRPLASVLKKPQRACRGFMAHTASPPY